MQHRYKLLSLGVLLALNATTYADEQLDLPVTPVTANPLGVSSDEFVVPFSVLNGRDLDVEEEIPLLILLRIPQEFLFRIGDRQLEDQLSVGWTVTVSVS